MSMTKPASILAVALLAAVLPPARAGIVWVDAANGSNGIGCGTSAAAACQTIQWGIDIALDGDTVRVLPGVYFENVSTAGRRVELLADAFATSQDRTTTVIDCFGVCDGDSGFYAPAVYLGNGSSLTGFTVRNAGGTGIEAVGSVTISQNLITGNEARLRSRGGGIYAYSTVVYPSTDPLVIQNNEIRNNSAFNLGGGLFVRAQARADRALRPVLVQGNIIRDNSTGAQDSRGAGAFVRAEGSVAPFGGQTRITITQNTIDGNFSTAPPVLDGDYPSGGGLWAAAYQYGSHEIQINGGNVIRNNRAGIAGGVGVFSYTEANGSAVINLSGNTVQFNQARLLTSYTDTGYGGYGGGIFGDAFGYGNETLTIQDNSVSDNTSLGFGGGMWVRSLPGDNAAQTVRVQGNTVAENEADLGAGIHAELDARGPATSSIAIDSNTVTDNVALTSGGGINADLRVADLGGVTSLSAANLAVTGNTIAGNSALGFDLFAYPIGRGGGARIQMDVVRTEAPGVSLAVEGNRVEDNSANFFGGGVSIEAAADSKADPGDPGSQPARTAANVRVANNLLATNRAESGDPNLPGVGGGLFLYLDAEGDATTTVTADFNTVANNVAELGAGGIEIESETDLDLLGNEGLALLSLRNSIVVRNTGVGVGGPVPGESGSVTDGGTGNFVQDVAYNDFFSNSGGNFDSWFGDPIGVDGNISENPLFDAAYVPETCSPVVNAADPLVDACLEPTPNGGIPDMGHLGTTPGAPQSIADITADRLVDGMDILSIAVSFAATSSSPRYRRAADLDCNGVVDGNDLVWVATQFGRSCP